MGVMNWVYRLSRWVLVGIFIYSGSSKLLAPKVFAVLIDAYGIVPENLLLPVALLLSVMEVAAGIGLVFDIRGALSIITGLLLLFITILGYGIWLGLDVDCGCFGPEDPEAEAFHGLRLALYRDLVMMGAIAYIYGWRRFRGIAPVRFGKLVAKLSNRGRTGDAYV